MFLCGMFEVERCKLGTGFPFHSEQFSQQKSMVQVTFLHAYFQIFYVVTNRYRCNILTYSISHNANVQMQTLTLLLHACTAQPGGVHKWVFCLDLHTMCTGK